MNHKASHKPYAAVQEPVKASLPDTAPLRRLGSKYFPSQWSNKMAEIMGWYSEYM